MDRINQAAVQLWCRAQAGLDKGRTAIAEREDGFTIVELLMITAVVAAIIAIIYTALQSMTNTVVNKWNGVLNK